MWNLIITGPNQPLQRRQLSGECTLIVGRSDDNEVVLPSDSVSRRHAQLSVSKEGVQIADLGSRNGTALNGRALGTLPRVIKPGDVATIGVFTLKLERVWEKGSASPNPDGFMTVLTRPLKRDSRSSISASKPGGSNGLASELSSAEAPSRLAMAIIERLGAPIQSLLDHAQFLKDSVLEIGRLMPKECTGSNPATAEQSGINDLLGEIPNSAAALLREASRLQALVAAAKDFSSLISEGPIAVDPNRIVAGALELTRASLAPGVEFDLHWGALNEVHLPPRILYVALFGVFESMLPKPQPPGAKIRIETLPEPKGISIRISQASQQPRDLVTTQTRGLQAVELFPIDQMLREHGGSLSVSADPGQDETLTLKLPFQTSLR